MTRLVFLIAVLIASWGQPSLAQKASRVRGVSRAGNAAKRTKGTSPRAARWAKTTRPGTVRRVFDPAKVLGRRRVHGRRVNPDKLKVKAHLFTGVSGRANHGRELGTMRLSYAGEKVGEATLYKLPQRKVYMSFLGGVKSEYRGKGFGSFFYYALASTLYEHNRLVLRSDPRELSVSARRVWKRLVREGYATRRGDTWQFKKSVLENPKSMGPVKRALEGARTVETEKFVEPHERDPGFFKALTRGLDEGRKELVKSEMDWLLEAQVKDLRAARKKRANHDLYKRSRWFVGVLDRAIEYRLENP